MIKTLVIIIITLIVVPFLAFNSSKPLVIHQMDILLNCIKIYVSVAAICFVIAQITGNFSKVYKIWSIAPMVYCWYIAFVGGLHEKLRSKHQILDWRGRLAIELSKRKTPAFKIGADLTGFYSKGLWKIIRHPNYMAAKAVWVSFYFIGVAGSGEWINWSIASSLLLTILFLGSSNFSESISLEKYPQYAGYIKSTGLFLPKIKNK